MEKVIERCVPCRVSKDGARPKLGGFGQLREERDERIEGWGRGGGGRLSIELSRDNRFETLGKKRGAISWKLYPRGGKGRAIIYLS